jgi:hypothetical protein
MTKPETVDAILANVAGRIAEQRGIPPEHAVAWVTERLDEPRIRLIIRVALRGYMEFASGEDEAFERELLYELIVSEVTRELDKGWRE